MKKIWENSLIFLLFIMFFIFKDSLYGLWDKKNLDFNYLKENELIYYQKEYQKLLSQNNIDFYDNEYILSKIIYRDIYDFYNKITISKGENLKIKKGNVVVNSQGLIGVVDKVNKKSSLVNILYNSDLKISVKLNDTFGILESKNNKLYVNHLVSQATINIGDIVYTSGLTDIPENIPIGKVTKIDMSNDKLSQIVEIKELADLKDTTYVVIINNKESDLNS